MRKLFIVLCVLMWPSLAAASWDEAQLAYDKGDFKTAIKELQVLADKGNPKAQASLGSMYFEGKGVPQDFKQAMTWFRKAAGQGNIAAQHNIGLMYNNGMGVPPDFKQAMAWYLKAAEQGDADSQNNIGGLYGQGQGVQKDYVQAYKWMSLAAANGNKGAITSRDWLVAHLTVSQLEEGRRLAREWSAKHTKLKP